MKFLQLINLMLQFTDFLFQRVFADFMLFLQCRSFLPVSVAFVCKFAFSTGVQRTISAGFVAQSDHFVVNFRGHAGTMTQKTVVFSPSKKLLR